MAGKGVAASLLMTHLSAIFRSLIPLDLPLGEVVSRANRLFCESTAPAHYATLACGRARRERRRTLQCRSLPAVAFEAPHNPAVASPPDCRRPLQRAE